LSLLTAVRCLPKWKHCAFGLQGPLDFLDRTALELSAMFLEVSKPHTCIVAWGQELVDIPRAHIECGKHGVPKQSIGGAGFETLFRVAKHEQFIQDMLVEVVNEFSLSHLPLFTARLVDSGTKYL